MSIDDITKPFIMMIYFFVDRHEHGCEDTKFFNKMVPNTTKIVLFAEKKHNFALSVYYILKYEAFCVKNIISCRC